MRKKLFTDGVLAQIPRWIVEDGLGPAEIAARIGCTVGTLRVVCSRNGLSLRKPATSQNSAKLQCKKAASPPTELLLNLSDESRSRLQVRAALLGLSESDLSLLLLETINKDDLYSALLDDC